MSLLNGIITILKTNIMGTNNFHNVNASKYFTVLMNKEQPILDEDGEETDETEEVPCEDFDYEMLTEDIIYLMKESKFDHNEGGGVANELRSYPSSAIGRLYISKAFAGVDVVVEITAILRSGYYEGANLDWEIKYNVEGSTNDEIDFAEDFEYAIDNNGMAKIQSRNAERWAATQTDLLVAELESIFQKVSDPYIKVAQFSNGEAIYAKA